MKKRIVALIAAVAVTALGGLYYLAVAGASPDRYTQIDGSRHAVCKKRGWSM